MKYLLCLLLIVGCEDPASIKVEQLTKGAVADYSFSDPARIFVMPAQLQEISGISIRNENELFCVEDEHGKIYTYNTVSDKMTDSREFAGAGDFEDIAQIKDVSYVLRSDGMIFKVAGSEISELASGLSPKDNAEGLCADTRNKRLLIASKAKSTIYAFDPEHKRLEELWTIDEKKFAPSALAIHPLTAEVYVLSSAGKELIILTSEGKIKQSHKLPGKHFKQPEGMAFAPNGDLYISNEGKGGNGNILLFRYQKN